jgi:hypothetical protein
MTELIRRIVLIFLTFIACASWLPAASLTLGTGTAPPTTTVSLPLSWTGGGDSVSSLEWTLILSTADFSGVQITAGPAATQAGKSLQCQMVSTGKYACLLTGMNAAVIPDGILANAILTVAGSVSTSTAQISLTSAAGATPAGDAETVVATGSAVTIPLVTRVSSLSCLPSSLRAGETAACTVNLTDNAPSTGANVSLGHATSQGMTVNMPASVTVPAGCRNVK